MDDFQRSSFLFRLTFTPIRHIDRRDVGCNENPSSRFNARSVVYFTVESMF